MLTNKRKFVGIGSVNDPFILRSLSQIWSGHTELQVIALICISVPLSPPDVARTKRDTDLSAQLTADDLKGLINGNMLALSIATAFVF